MSLAINSFQINAHELAPTTNSESLDISLATNSFQINKSGITIICRQPNTRPSMAAYFELGKLFKTYF